MWLVSVWWDFDSCCCGCSGCISFVSMFWFFGVWFWDWLVLVVWDVKGYRLIWKGWFCWFWFWNWILWLGFCYGLELLYVILLCFDWWLLLGSDWFGVFRECLYWSWSGWWVLFVFLWYFWCCVWGVWCLRFCCVVVWNWLVWLCCFWFGSVFWGWVYCWDSGVWLRVWFCLE